MKKNKMRFRFDLILVFSLFVLLISFCAYMINVSLENVLKEELGSEVITHEYINDSEMSEK